MRLAQQAHDANHEEIPLFLDTLAAGYAELGRFDEAQTTQRQAMQWAEQTGQAELAKDLSGRVPVYVKRQAYRQRLPATSDR